MDRDKLDQFTAFVQAQPVSIIPNPHWEYDAVEDRIMSQIDGAQGAFHLNPWTQLLLDVRIYFKHTYDAFKSEAQVLCVREEDATKLYDQQIPRLPKTYAIGDLNVVVFVLPQTNSFHVTSIGEGFWQTYIVNQGIHPVARIHSHHILDPYQSSTDYASLNSNTLEMVIGQIYDEPLAICYWLDVRSTDTKNNVWVGIQSQLEKTHFAIRKIPCGGGKINKTPDFGTLGATAGKRDI